MIAYCYRRRALMTDILVRGLKQETIEILKRRAAENGRSLQQELHAIFTDAAADPERFASRMAYFERAKAMNDRLAASGRNFGDSAREIREDRDSNHGRA